MLIVPAAVSYQVVGGFIQKEEIILNLLYC